jgi:hypothetical protein
MDEAFDPEPLAFYDLEAPGYAAIGVAASPSPHLAQFLTKLKTDAHIHELGCGGAPTYKAGSGGGRDSMGRYFSYPAQDELQLAYVSAGPWTRLQIDRGAGGGYDQVPTQWLSVVAELSAKNGHRLATGSRLHYWTRSNLGMRPLGN